MILGPVSLLDCLAFLVFLVPRFIIEVGFFRTALVALRCVPFVFFQMPVQLVRERYLTRREKRSPFVVRASLFEDLVIRCVRFAFREVPASVGRTFFSKWVSLPWLRWRMLRHGYLVSPIGWREYAEEGPEGFRGTWITADPSKPPDMVMYYVHGGGFALGSTYFYLEFLLAWFTLLQESGYENPAIFALEYTLVPDKTYPTQVHEVLRGYRHVISAVGNPRKIVVAGDSAGGTLVLTMLLELGQLNDAWARRQKLTKEARNDSDGQARHWQSASETPLPGLAVLISPWTMLISDKHKTNNSDFLDAGQLHEYAMQYAGREHIKTPTVSPGLTANHHLWAQSSPECGFFVTYGSEEVFAPDIEEFIRIAVKGAEVDSRREEGGIHAWPVVSMFLASSEEKRFRGLRTLTGAVRKHIF